MTTLTELSFGNRIKPEEVTSDVRNDLAREEWRDEGTWMGLLAVFFVMVSLGFSLAYRWHGDPPKAELPAIGIVALVAILGLIAVHVAYALRRKFLKKAPATLGLVLEAEPSYKYSDDSATHQKSLKLRYAPGYPDSHAAEVATLFGDGTVTVSTELNAQSPGFVDEVEKGVFVTLLYDPANLRHVRVVEKVVAHHEAPLAA